MSTTWYVDDSAPAQGANGENWATAYPDLQQALSQAQAGDEIRVGQGTYRPTSGTDRTISFRLKADVTLRGGYAGVGAADPNARNTVGFASVLSGNIGLQNTDADNSFHVVDGGSGNAAGVFDGFVVTDGRAVSTTAVNDQRGGGLYAAGTNLTIINCSFVGNTASLDGGGIYLDGGGAAGTTITNTTIKTNLANLSGGGLSASSTNVRLEGSQILDNVAILGGGIAGNFSSLTVTGTAVVGNVALGTDSGGGVSINGGSFTLADSTLIGNSAQQGHGGGLAADNAAVTVRNSQVNANRAFGNGGGLSLSNTTSSVVNSTLIGNTAGGSGGAVAIDGPNAASIVNTTLVSNSSTIGGGAVDGTPATVIANSIVANSAGPAAIAGATVHHSLVTGGFAGTGNVNADPKFVEAPSAGGNGLWDAGDNFGNLRLQYGSAAIDAGDNASVPGGVTTDLAGKARITDVAGGNGSGAVVDMGAYEALPATKLVFGAAPAGGAAGTLGAFSVTVQNELGETVTTADSQVALSLANSPAGAAIGGTASVAAVNGVATFNNVLLTKPGTYALTASSGTLTSVTSGAFDIAIGALNTIQFVVAPASHAAGNAFGVTVKLSDAFGNVLAGAGPSVSLSLLVSPAGSTLGGTLTRATVDGIATFDGLQLTKAGTYQIRGTLQGGGTSLDSAAFDITPGAAANVFFAQAPAAATANQPFSASVRVEDAFGNVVTTGNPSVTLSIATGPNGAGLLGTTTKNAFAGIATFDPIGLSQAGTYTLRATLDGVGATATTAAFDVATATGPVVPAGIQLVGVPTNNGAGQALNFTARLVDAFGQLVTTGANPITISFTAPAGAPAQGPVVVETTAGVATVNGISLTKAGQYTITASFGNLTDTENLVVLAGPASQLVVATQPGNATAGGNFGVTVNVQDAFGNVADNTPNVTVGLGSNPAGGTLTGTFVVPTVNGVATFNGLSLNKAGAYTLTISAPGIGAVESNSFTITPGAATKLAFVPAVGNSTVGGTFGATVVAQDAFDNFVTTDVGNVSVRVATGPAGAAFRGTTTKAAANGTATFDDLRLYHTGDYTLVAELAGLTSATSNTITIAAASQNVILPVTTPATMTAGAKSTFKVQLLDPNGDLLTKSKAKVGLVVQGGPGAFLGKPAGKTKNGEATFTNVVLTKAGTYTIGATAAGFGTATLGSTTANAGAPFKATFTAPATVAHGTAFAAQVKVTDKYGNAANSGQNVVLSLAKKPAGAQLLGTTTRVVDASGTASFDDLVLSTAGAHQLQATTAGLKKAVKSGTITAS